MFTRLTLKYIYKFTINDCLTWFNLFLTEFQFFFIAKIECGLYFLDRFDVLMLKIIFKK
jgi:hypothetical protein